MNKIVDNLQEACLQFIEFSNDPFKNNIMHKHIKHRKNKCNIHNLK